MTNKNIDGKIVDEAECNLSDRCLFKKILSENGAGMVEYALLVALMSIGCVSAISLLATQTEEQFNFIANAIATGEITR